MDVPLPEYLSLSSVRQETASNGLHLLAKTTLHVIQFDDAHCTDITHWRIPLVLRLEIRSSASTATSVGPVIPLVAGQDYVGWISGEDQRLRIVHALNAAEGFTIRHAASIVSTQAGSVELGVLVPPSLASGRQYLVEFYTLREVTVNVGEYDVTVYVDHPNSGQSNAPVIFSFPLSYEDPIFSGDLGGTIKLSMKIQNSKSEVVSEVKFPEIVRVVIADEYQAKPSNLALRTTDAFIVCFNNLKTSDLYLG